MNGQRTNSEFNSQCSGSPCVISGSYVVIFENRLRDGLAASSRTSMFLFSLRHERPGLAELRAGGSDNAFLLFAIGRKRLSPNNHNGPNLATRKELRQLPFLSRCILSRLAPLLLLPKIIEIGRLLQLLRRNNKGSPNNPALWSKATMLTPIALGIAWKEYENF